MHLSSEFHVGIKFMAFEVEIVFNIQLNIWLLMVFTLLIYFKGQRLTGVFCSGSRPTIS